MAIAIRGGSPATASFSGLTNPSLTLTGAQQPQTSDLLVIVHGNNFYALANMSTPTVGGSTSGVTSIGVDADGGSNLGHIRAFTYVVPSTGDLTVASVETGTHDEEKILAVYVLSGADTGTPLDGTPVASNGSGSTTAVVAGITTSATDSYLITHITPNGTADTGATTPPGSMTETYEIDVASTMDGEGAVQQLVTSGATGTRTFTLTNPQPWIALAFAIRTASASGPTVDPVTPFEFMPPGRVAPNGFWVPFPALVMPDAKVTAVTSTVIGVATATATAAKVAPAVGTVIGVATATATVKQVLPTPGTVVGVATVTSTVVKKVAVTGTVVGVATVTSTATSGTARAAQGTVVGVATVTSTVVKKVAVTGTVIGVGVTGSTAVKRTPVGSSVVGVGVTGSIVTRRTPVATTVIGVAVSQAVAVKKVAVTGRVVGVASVTGLASQLGSVRAVTGRVVGVASVTVRTQAWTRRPNTGTTTRPNTGTTTRPNTGTTYWR